MGSDDSGDEDDFFPHSLGGDGYDDGSDEDDSFEDLFGSSEMDDRQLQDPMASQGNDDNTVKICEECEEQPAVVLCESCIQVLCSSCDGLLHQGDPLEFFSFFLLTSSSAFCCCSCEAIVIKISPLLRYLLAHSNLLILIPSCLLLVSISDEMATHVRTPHGTETEMDGFNDASSSEVCHPDWLVYTQIYYIEGYPFLMSPLLCLSPFSMDNFDKRKAGGV